MAGRCLLNTWLGLETRGLNSLLSASAARSAKDKPSSGRKPPLCSRPISFSSRSLSRAEVKPHQAGEAYNLDARVVERAITCSWGTPQPMGPQHAQRMDGRGARGKNLIQVIAHCKVGRQDNTKNPH